MASCSRQLSKCCLHLLNNGTTYNPVTAKSDNLLLVRKIHKSVATSEVVTQGCERLPDLTMIWPFHLWPSDVAATALDQVQQANGLPWWATIAVGGVLVKLPLFGYNVFNFRRIQKFATSSTRPMTHFVMMYLNNLVTKGEKHALKMANDERRFTIVREGMNPELSLKPTMASHVSYLPLYWISGMHLTMLCAINWLNRIQYVPLLSGGLPWCLNLTLSDPYMVVPMACLLSGCLNLYLHPMHWMLPIPEFKLRHFIHLSPVLAVAFSILSAIPVDFVFYMCAANLTSCILNSLLKYPAVQYEVGLMTSGEVFNRMIPPSHVFKELGKTCERQVILLKQKEEQLLLADKQKELLESEGKESLKLLVDDSTSEDVNKTKEKKAALESQNDVRFVKRTKVSNDQPHLNLEKIFNKNETQL